MFATDGSEIDKNRSDGEAARLQSDIPPGARESILYSWLQELAKKVPSSLIKSRRSDLLGLWQESHRANLLMSVQACQPIIANNRGLDDDKTPAFAIFLVRN